MNQNDRTTLTLNEKLGVMEAIDHLFLTQMYSEGQCYESFVELCSKSSDAVYRKNEKKCEEVKAPFNMTNESIFDRIPYLKETQKSSPMDLIKSKNHISSSSLDGLTINQNVSPFSTLLHKNSKSFIKDIVREPNPAGYLHTMKSNRNFLKNSKTSNGDSPNYQKFTPKKDVQPITSPKKCMANSSIKISNKPSNVKEIHVLCTYRESENRYWVMNSEDANTFVEIQKVLDTQCEDFETVYPAEGDICACTYENEWCRGKIVSVVPKIMVHFIDYGNTADYGLELVKKLPKKLCSIPGLVYLIEFEDGTPVKYKSENLDSVNLVVEKTRKASDDVICVKILEGHFGRTVVDLKNRSVIDTLWKDCKGKIFFSFTQGQIRFGAVVPDDHTNANYCWNETSKFKDFKCSPRPAKEGEYGMMLLEEEKFGSDPKEKKSNQRGKVICQLGLDYFVYFVDYGKFLFTDRVSSIPEKWINLIELGGKVTIEETEEDLLHSVDSVGFHLTGEIKSGKWSCDFINLNNQQKIGRGTIEKPLNLKNKPPIQYMHLTSGCTVQISAFISVKNVFVRVVDRLTDKMYNTMCKKINEVAERANGLLSLPKMGELCCVKYSKTDSFSRAQVTEIHGDEFKVLFIDFGESEKIHVREIKSLPEFLKNIPYFAIKVHLKNISEEDCTKSLTDYIQNAILSKKEFTMEFEKNLSDGVNLIDKEGKSIISHSFENIKKKESVENLPVKYAACSNSPTVSDFISDSDLEFAKLTPGTKCNLVVLYIKESEFRSTFSFWATDAGSKNVTHVFGDMSKEINDYCNSVQRPYRPREQEVCLAEFEGDWFRALIINIEDDDFTVFFLDFGNTCTLTSQFIRKIIPKFTEAPVLALNCVIHDYERLKDKPELMNQVFNILKDNSSKTFLGVDVTRSEDDMFSVIIPEIKRLL